MNRWGLMSALALAAALLLAGCGGDYGLSDDDSADEPQITLEQIRAANDPRSLLEKHGADEQEPSVQRIFFLPELLH